ncbi:protein Skeletor, isoforms B/C isoform X1 [Drosophila takahashii]|uniref:protein Skeletor, isoforms B/C isoform X1 n=1 Tax=Drosophila takahashii TaxID=29030 RepID=UPI001CF8B56E|nr:protein Skeletor, isoforms B/C isoform X1 [Drosophila takahashii]
MLAMKDKPWLLLFGLLAALSCLASFADAAYPYYGTKIGALTRLHHGVSGDVYAVDSRTIFIKKFNYDGEAPAAYFYVGNTARPSNEGAARLRDERGGTASLTRRYRNKDVTLSLPEGKTLRDIKWFSVWCDEFAVNFGDVSIPANLDFPRPQKINALRGVHGVSSDNIVIVDAQTLLVPNFSYDGEAPDAKFWVGRGQRPTSEGLRIPDENGKENPLRRYERKTIVLTLPEDLTIFDIGHFGVWCEAFTVDFGHVRLPEGLNVPPSLKMLGISPQSKLNCEVLYDDLAFEVRWAVAGESIVVQLVAKLEPNHYMSFGISPSKNISQMIGADAVVAWVDPQTGNGFATDYFLEGKAQCSGGRGACPDTKIQEKTNSIRLLNAAMVNGYSIVTYQRSLAATDRLDLPISITEAESVVWAIGPLNDYREVSFHTFYNKHLHNIEFGRQPKWNCPLPEGARPGSNSSEQEDSAPAAQSSTGGAGYPPAGRPNVEPEEEFYENRAEALHRQPPQRRQETAIITQRRPVPTPKPVNSNGAWDIPAIQCHEPEDGVFYAQMGPTGGKHGYPAITGHVGWGISWYINGLLIPEIHVVRGRTYTFVVEGGNNPDIPAKYHPFYISDDPVGGYEHKREEEKKAVRIYAGVHRSRSGQVTPTGVGRLCNWTPDVEGPPADDYQSFGAYQRTLTLKCDAGEPGVISWKPDRSTPDTVYYHCFTHRYLGWKIHVHDACDSEAGGLKGSASERHEIRLPAAAEATSAEPAPVHEDYAGEASVRHETKVSANDNFLLKHQTDLIKNHNMNGTPPKLSFEITKSSEITKLISDGIRAAEALEESLKRNPNLNPNLNLNPNQQPNQYPKANVTPEILLGETHAHKPNASPSASASASAFPSPSASPSPATLKLPIFASGPHLIHHPPHPLHRLHHHPQHAPHSHPHPHLHLHHHNLTANLPALAQKTIGLSEFLRPPQNAPLFHPVKLPGRRPFPAPIKKVPASRPVLPQQHPHLHPQHPVLLQQQPSLIVSHYRKPVPGLLKPFVKEKPFPLQPLAASVLLLGQPTELGGGLGGLTAKGERLKVKGKPKIPVPYVDLEPQGSLQNTAFFNQPGGKGDPKPIAPSSSSSSMSSSTTTTPLVKRPAVKEPSQEEIASMRPAVNQGFKPDTVIVESGFRPIMRTDGTGVQLPKEIIEQVANRREDPGTEIDEVMETDTLFLTAQQGGSETQSFEPMFIPSPLDSTNASKILRVNVKEVSPTASALRLPSAALEHALPSASELRKPTLDELFGEELNEEELELESLPQGDDEEETTKNSATATTKEIPSTTTKKPKETELLEDLFGPDEEDIYADELELEMDDRVAAAAERIDTYYLPPDNRKVPHASLPSGALYTFDGKSVVDSSLVLPPKLDAAGNGGGVQQRHAQYGLTPLEQLVRTTPQFGIFRGELPQEFRGTEPQPVSEYSHPAPFSRTTGSTTPAFSSSSGSTIYPYSSSPGTSTSASFSPSSSSSSPLSSSSLRPISTKLQLLRPEGRRA